MKPLTQRRSATPKALKKGPRPFVHDGNMEYERMKATRRNLSPLEAVRECDALCNLYRRSGLAMPGFYFDLPKIFRALQARKIPFVLTGAHGIGAWTGRPRATHDLDILVRAGRQHARAVKVLRELFPNLEVKPLTGVTAFFVPGETMSVLDVAYPHRADLEETLKTAVWVVDEGGKYRIPALEAALANKYGAMLSLNRDAGKRGQDGVDFFFMVKHSQDEGRTPIDLQTLASLGEKVWPEGGGQEILSMVEMVHRGEVPNPTALPQARRRKT